MRFNDNISSTNYYSEIRFTAQQDGYFFLEVGGTHGDTGGYRVGASLLRRPPRDQRDDYANHISTTGRISVDGTARGNIETSGDTDWFRVRLTAGRTYRIDQEGTPTERGTLTDPYIRGVYDRNGNYISNSYNDDSGTGYNARLTFSPARTGYYYISAGAYSSRLGTYRLSVRQVANSVARASMAQQNLVFNGGETAQAWSNSVVTPLSAALDKDWQKNLLAFSRS